MIKATVLIATLLFLPITAVAKLTKCDAHLLVHNPDSPLFSEAQIADVHMWMADLGLNDTYPAQIAQNKEFLTYLAHSNLQWNQLDESGRIR
jgi:hypothetical protein